MPLKETLDAAIKQAMLAKDKVRLTTLRSLKSQIMLAETAEGAQGAALTPDAELKLLNKAAKQRRDAATIYKEQFRSELESNELAELAIIEEYLPQQLTEADLVERLVHIIQRVGAQGPSDLGKVMGVAARELSGQADGKMISQVVSNLLNNTNQ
ncbi:GatB/YqeY domain-containing protein [Hymenobacter coccineus]|uniref:Glutamyl-tRNA amidotransferase n=1 Tax=Hymenobacter coccineus TaxID=1908235 RepID=A0A1G1TIS7_9BACT|nr:GatB/YqeY domain-containing protein [Hymenobacter coccineus]OGX90766.1 glutamyl-tRNA amidotransferase [Hymenobacter coccineus]